MDVELLSKLQGEKHEQWLRFLRQMGLDPDEGVERTALVWEDGELIATGSRQGNVLKCIAVDPLHQGEGLTATLLTQLRQDAFADGLRHLFLYTKPRNQTMFSSLFFYPIAKTGQVLLMENQKNAIGDFLGSLEKPCTSGKIGAAVMNCNPFTRGHRWLIETASKACDWLYIFVLSENRGMFPAEDRLELVRQGTADLPNVTIHPTGPYLISSATFPTYFLKDKEQAGAVQCELDVEIFVRHFVPAFGITHRFVGTEPMCQVTNAYNGVLEEFLPKNGIELCKLQRLEQGGDPISASAVRKLLGQNQPEKLRSLVPDTTFEYLKSHNMI